MFLCGYLCVFVCWKRIRGVRRSLTMFRRVGSSGIYLIDKEFECNTRWLCVYIAVMLAVTAKLKTAHHWTKVISYTCALAAMTSQVTAKWEHATKRRSTSICYVWSIVSCTLFKVHTYILMQEKERKTVRFSVALYIRIDLAHNLNNPYWFVITMYLFTMLF